GLVWEDRPGPQRPPDGLRGPGRLGYGETSIAGSSLATGPEARYRGTTPSLGHPVVVARLTHRAALRGQSPRDALAAPRAHDPGRHEGAPASDRLSSSSV